MARRFGFIAVFWLLQPVVAGEPQSADAPLRDYFPDIEPFETGYLKVSDGHEIYYELCGNREGKPAMLLHGGPGGGSYPTLRRYHDPAKYLIVLHDQRGAGKSKPYCELRDNNTQALVQDIERLRTHLKLGKVQVFGGSWGSTLAVAYAEAYPDNVSALILRGVFLATKEETDYFYHGGAGLFFPDAFERLQAIVPHPERHDYPQQLLDLIRGDDAEKRERAARGWAWYETKMGKLRQSDAEVDASLNTWKYLDFSLIENYYMANDCFLAEGQLLRDAPKIAHLPAFIVQGRYDVICPPAAAYKLHKALPRSKLVLVEAAGHSGSEPGIRSALIEAARSLE
ncbi:MAG: prolyl aminopeptidase [Planctomycetes bacterium]|nr:prolyl aminopeptidase [Planctomycetota bacterium]